MSWTSSRSHSGWVPVGAVHRLEFGLGRQRLGQVLGEGVRDVDTEAVHAAVGPEPQRGEEVLAHLRLSQLRSGCSGANRCRYHCPSPHRVQAGPPNIEVQSAGGSSPFAPRPSRKMYRSRSGEPFGAASASWNQTCRFEEWLGTMSTMSLMPGGVQRRDHGVEVGEGAQSRVDVAVVVDVVAAVGQRGRVERAEPDGVDPEPREVGHARGDPGRSPMPSPFASAKLRG